MSEPDSLALHLLREMRAEMASKADLGRAVLEYRSAVSRVEQHLKLEPSEAR